MSVEPEESSIAFFNSHAGSKPVTSYHYLVLEENSWIRSSHSYLTVCDIIGSVNVT